ncbi:hypothetical protein Hanom_Chr04g00316631 [Helianthus anomalus]
MFVRNMKKTELPFKLTKKTEIPLNQQKKMDGVNEPDENGKISNLLDLDAGNTNLWTKVAKLAKPQGRKRQFTLFLNGIDKVAYEKILNLLDFPFSKVKT